MYYKQEIGRDGENEVVKYLEQNDYKILERNFSCKIGEIDIIALDKKEIVFIEVKSRTSIKYGLPSEAVTRIKLKHIYRTAEYYILTRNLYNLDARIDVVEVYMVGKKYIINHLKQVV